MYHPDKMNFPKHVCEAKCHELNSAYNILKNPVLKKKYDDFKKTGFFKFV